jgi:GH24 family phage-related lysozyme (muramidase)
MKTSQRGINLLKEFEGCVLTAYWDYKGYSIGYGHLGAKEGQTITKEEA